MSILDDILSGVKKIPGAVESGASHLGSALNLGYNPENTVTSANDMVNSLSKPIKDVSADVFFPGPNSQPAKPATPPASTPPAPPTPEPLSYQGMLTKYFEPLIKSVGAGLGPSQVNQALGQYQGVPASIGQGIAKTLQTSIEGWQGGLQSMLTALPQEAPEQAILAGMKSLLSYPVASLSGTQGAPPGVTSSDALMQLYTSLNQERNGIAPTSSTANNALAGLSVQSLTNNNG